MSYKESYFMTSYTYEDPWTLGSALRRGDEVLLEPRQLVAESAALQDIAVLLRSYKQNE